MFLLDSIEMHLFESESLTLSLLMFLVLMDFVPVEEVAGMHDDSWATATTTKKH